MPDPLGTMPNPTDAKVTAATIGAGVSGAVVTIIMALVNHQPAPEAAISTVLVAVVSAVIAYGSGWLKTTPLPDLIARLDANKAAIVEQGGARKAGEAGHVDVQTILVMFAVAVVVLALYVLLFAR